MLAKIAHEHYEALPGDYDFSRIAVDSAKMLTDFFRSYARSMIGTVNRVGWNVAAV